MSEREFSIELTYDDSQEIFQWTTEMLKLSDLDEKLEASSFNEFLDLQENHKQTIVNMLNSSKPDQKIKLNLKKFVEEFKVITRYDKDTLKKSITHVSTLKKLNSILEKAKNAEGKNQKMIVQFTNNTKTANKKEINHTKFVSSITFSALALKLKYDCTFINIQGKEAMKIARTHNIESFPTFHFYINGEKQEEITFFNQKQLSTTLDNNIWNDTSIFFAKKNKNGLKNYKKQQIKDKARKEKEMIKKKKLIPNITENFNAIGQQNRQDGIKNYNNSDDESDYESDY